MSIKHSYAFSHRDQLQSVIAENFDSTLDRLKELVAIPSIAWESFDLTQVQRSAEKVSELAQEVGFDSVEILTARYGEEGKEGMPAVVARKEAAPGYPTVLLYAHHDVQPVGDRSLWNTEPFEATRVGDRLFGRGAADDKAGVLAHLAAFSAVKETLGDDFKVGVTLFIEGEEEAGSPSFADFLYTYQNKLASDVIVVADSSNWKAGVPALTTSLRGVASGVIKLTSGDHAVHSGMFGGPMLDANTLMVHLLASLHKPNGSVAVEGLEVASKPEVEYEEADFRADSGILDSVELAGEDSITSRLWAQPAISIIGMDITPVAEASNTINVTSTAKISVRLAPGQDPAQAHRLIEEHLKKNAPLGAQVQYRADDSGQPFQANTEEPSVGLALAAMQESWQVEPVKSGMGGSIPFIADLKEVFPSADILITGIEDPDTRAHSANESLYLPDFEKAILAESLILSELSAGATETK
ncbi:dipeptidase [Rothia aerolata]|uniref:Dipeptidase n=1 Tax=Rothia aerolata TaxID=1812262 RepID=A0A917IM84_9MICC|nr:dipeptidase [Rothia aerolata]GGH57564.1 dipeptidase [Rothia aerolata]